MNRRLRWFLVGATSLSLIVSLGAATSATSATSQQEFEGKMARSYEESVEWWAPKERPPEGAPINPPIAHIK